MEQEQEFDYGCASCTYLIRYKGYPHACRKGTSLNERHPTNDGGWMCEHYIPIELAKLKEQIAVLKEVLLEYPGKTIGNIIQQMEARVKHFEQIYKI